MGNFFHAEEEAILAEEPLLACLPPLCNDLHPQCVPRYLAPDLDQKHLKNAKYVHSLKPSFENNKKHLCVNSQPFYIFL